MGRKRIPPQAVETFILALAEGCSVGAAAKRAGVSRSLVYQWRANAGVARRWADATETATDLLEDEARRRALDGVEKPIFRNGQHVADVKTMSDRLLMALLAARRPERFGAMRRTEQASPTDAAPDSAKASLERKLARLARHAGARPLPAEAD